MALFACDGEPGGYETRLRERTRWGRAGGIVAGAGWAASGVFALALPGEGAGPIGSASSYLVEASHAVAEGGMLLWLLGLRGGRGRVPGKLATAGFVAAFAGTAILFVLTALTPLQMFLAVGLGVIDPSAGGMVVGLLFLTGLILGWLVGYTVLGISVLRDRVMPFWAGPLLLLQAPAILFLMAFYGAGGLLLGALWVLLGVALASTGATETGVIERVEPRGTAADHGSRT